MPSIFACVHLFLRLRVRSHERRSELKPVWNTWNEMPTHVHQNIGSLWNATEMKIHVNRTCFHAGLKSQTSMSSCCFSCERTLTFAVLSHVYTRPEVNSNQFEISLRGKISLRCEVTSLSAFTWLRAEWNSLRCKFHFGQIDRSEISNRSEFSM